MMKAEFVYPLGNGEMISESEILQPFMVYRRIRKSDLNHYVLMPKLNQMELNDIFILSNKKGIRIYDKNIDSRLYNRINQLIDRKKNSLSLVNRFVGDRAVIDKVCKELIHNINYLKNENN